MEKSKLLGILGGLGPMSTVYFYELLTALTDAKCDQEHIDIVISSRATTPDRTRYILGESDENPLDAMIPDAQKLVSFGAEIIAIPCNTAHYFYDRLAAEIDVPILNIIEESVLTLKRAGVERFGLLATDGTVRSHTYQKYCSEHKIECIVPDEAHQARVMEIIYGQIKQNRRANMESFYEISHYMRSLGCEKLILGCTELSLVKKQEGLGDFYVDSLECLALATIKACGKRAISL
ncbi:MAG: aspartate/glutamate racemase family protein [Clostridiales bacterium]|nr:aspartate/glutamate racemase family protein [Clostridiales bacterium]